MYYKEIHPFVYVYPELIPDAQVLHAFLKESAEKSKGNFLFKGWRDWYTFGISTDNVGSGLDGHQYPSPEDTDNIFIKEKYIESRVKEIREKTISHYVQFARVQTNLTTFIPDAVNIGMYFPDINTSGNQDEQELVMQYHTDFSVANAEKPCNNFLLTCNIYFNDDYNGGEILFYSNGGFFEYKPKAGDVMVFPSGSPEFPGGNPYFHGVRTVKNGNKFISRNYLMYENPASQDWIDGVNTYGLDEWLRMEKERVDSALPQLNIFGITANQKHYNKAILKYYKDFS